MDQWINGRIKKQINGSFRFVLLLIIVSMIIDYCIDSIRSPPIVLFHSQLMREKETEHKI